MRETERADSDVPRGAAAADEVRVLISAALFGVWTPGVWSFAPTVRANETMRTAELRTLRTVKRRGRGAAAGFISRGKAP